MYRLLPMSIELPFFSINGVIGATISPLDRGFAYGDGLFETCRFQTGAIPLWSLHRDRLVSSAERLKIRLDESVLLGYLEPLLARLSATGIATAVVKIQITRGVGGRGYRVAGDMEPTYCIAIFPTEPLRGSHYLEGVDVRVCHQRLSANKVLAGMKHLNRLEQILARAEWQEDYAEGLLLDDSGSVIEATVSNIFVVKDAQLFTPDLSSCGVAGVMRRMIIERLAPSLSLQAKITDMSLEFICEADELFLCNSVYGIWPVNRVIDERGVAAKETHFLSPRVSRQLQILLEQFFALTD